MASDDMAGDAKRRVPIHLRQRKPNERSSFLMASRHLSIHILREGKV